jgi:16S rRNA (cytosine967-C5)-methyltransferase
VRRHRGLEGRADVVLVDAPCSGAGALRRNIDMAWKFGGGGAELEELQARQLQVLKEGGGMVKKGGRLVYATCSTLREENEAVVEAFLEGGGFEMLNATKDLAARGVEVANSGMFVKLSPLHHGTDGFFAALLRKL